MCIRDRAEAAVKNMKSLVLRARSTGENFHHALAAWRNTTRQDGTSPAQLFFGRRQRLGLPVVPEALDQSASDPSARDLLHENRCKNRDKSTACFSDFAVGDKVWMQHHATKKWYKTAIITEIRHGTAHNSVPNLGSSAHHMESHMSFLPRTTPRATAWPKQL